MTRQDAEVNRIEINKGLDKNYWQITCMLFAPNAPEQNPVEDIRLKGKSWIRKHFIDNKTFTQVKESFPQFLSNHVLNFLKFAWYNCDNLQLI